MLIAAVTQGTGTNAVIPERFEDGTNLMIVETDRDMVISVYKKREEDSLLFAKMTVRHDCEAIVCGKMQKEEFEEIAAASITRYYGAGLAPIEAAKAAEYNLLPFITDFEGGTGCGSHEVNMCEEHLKEQDDE